MENVQEMYGMHMGGGGVNEWTDCFQMVHQHEENKEDETTWMLL